MKGGISPLSGKHVVVIGAGGAGKAVAYGAKQRGAIVFIANRHYGKNLLSSTNTALLA